MVLKKRERILASVTAVFVVLFLGNWLWSAWGGPGSQPSQRDGFLREIEQKKRKIKKGEEAEAQLAQWRQRSLPTDPELARSAYQGWLLASAEAAGLKDIKVNASQGRQQRDVYLTLPFRLQAESTVEDLTRFLHAFYSAGYLHQIQYLDIVPRGDGKKVGLTFTIEALALVGTTRAKLPEKPSAPTLAADASEYAKAIADRNLFAPPRKPEQTASPSPPPPEFDPSKFVFLTAIVAVGGDPEAWVVNRTSGETLRLHQGDAFQVGERHAKVQRIGHREAEIELDGRTFLLLLGKDLGSSAKAP